MEGQLVEIEMDQHIVIEKEEVMKETSSVRDKDFYGGVEPNQWMFKSKILCKKRILARKTRKNRKLIKS
jgi:hypothetical protein